MPLSSYFDVPECRATERWLKEEVVRAFDAMKADPTRAIPIKDVFAEIRALHASRLKDQP